MAVENNLRLSLAITADSEEGGRNAAGLDTFADKAALKQQRWRGYRMPAGPSALPVGPVRHLLLQEFAADWAPPPARNGFWCWSGVQLLPGNRLSPDAAGSIVLLMMDIDPAYEEEFNAWYDTEHLPHVNMIPGVMIARRYRALAGTPRYLNVFSADEPEVTQRADFARYFRTPWTQRLWPKTKNHERYLFQPAR